MKRLLFAIIAQIIISSAFGQPSIVKIIQEGNSYSLTINDKPFYVKGVVGDTYLEKVQFYGGNSIRMGSRKDGLDKAQKLGLNVLVNLPANAERYGFDYNDTAAVRKQTERIVSIVNQTKDHPAVLMWAIGNELDYIPPYEPFNPKVWDAVNQAAQAIHSIDPHHPVMTVIGTSMMFKVKDIVKRCPDIDLLGINTYGDLYTLNDTLIKYGWAKPYVITEWGPDGYWEVPKTPWRAPYEQTAREKYDCYRKKYLEGISRNRGKCLGSYVFYWAPFKQETTHTWFCMFGENDLETPLPGLMYQLWTGKKKPNIAPVADSMRIASFKKYEPAVLSGGKSYSAELFAADEDEDQLSYRWEIRPEAVYASYAGQGEKVPQPVEGLIDGASSYVTFKAPSKPGPYRLFGYVYDGKGHFSSVNLPFLVEPVLADTASLGKYTSRTINLLNGTSHENANKVKILVYGQSISEQQWWLRVKKYVEDKYPDADILMENKAIGGFAAQILYKTVEMDVSSFYPDLVLLHIYGDNRYYDSVLYTIRSRTAAEVAIMTDHYTGENAWSDTMSYHLLPALAEKYKCDLVNIRDSWRKYLTDNSIEPSRLLRDGVHLNEYGNLIMAELVKPLFTFRPGYSPDPFGLCSTFTKGKDLKFRGKNLVLPFYGNRAEVIVDKEVLHSVDSVKVLVDDQAPSSFPGSYFMSRPFNNTGKEWPWELPVMIHISHSAPWINEEWICTFTHAEPPYTDFSFSIVGSVTGNDGEGRSIMDFQSRSGRIIIRGGDAGEGGDWHLHRSYTVLKTIVNTGDAVKLKTYHIGMDYFPTHIITVNQRADYPVLFQGIPNSEHILKLVRTGNRVPPIKAIRIYKPFLD